MKVKNSILFACFASLFCLLVISSASMLGQAATSVTFPGVTVITTATVDIDPQASLRLSKYLPMEETAHIKGIQKTSTGLRLIINSNLQLTSTSDEEDVVVEPAVEKEGDVNSWQLERFIEKGTAYFENLTDQSDAYAITNDFNSATYELLVIKKAKTNSTATTITVSYSDSLSGDISDAADTTNTTIYSKFIPSQKLIWFRLDLEANNSSRPYILHIAFDELICDSIQIFSIGSSQDFRDERYATVYMGSSETAVNVSELGTTTDWHNYYTASADYTENWQDNTIKGVGFATADDFEDSLYETWVKIINNELLKVKDYSYKAIDVGDIDDYALTALDVNCELPQPISKLIYDLTTKAEGEGTDIPTIVKSVRDESIRRFTITSAISPNILQEDEDAEGLTDMSNAVVASAERSKGSSTSFAVDFKEKVTNAVGKISDSLGIFMGKVKEKIISVTSNNWALIGIIGGSALLGLGLIITVAVVASKKK